MILNLIQFSGRIIRKVTYVLTKSAYRELRVTERGGRFYAD
jgi:hypothetical protein